AHHVHVSVHVGRLDIGARGRATRRVFSQLALVLGGARIERPRGQELPREQNDARSRQPVAAAERRLCSARRLRSARPRALAPGLGVGRCGCGRRGRRVHRAFRRGGTLAPVRRARSRRARAARLQCQVARAVHTMADVAGRRREARIAAATRRRVSQLAARDVATLRGRFVKKKQAPSADASAQLKRLLAMVPRIADGEEHSMASIAAMLGATPDTIANDLVSFGERYDTPGGFVEGLQVFIEAQKVSVRTSHFLRPMRLTVAELRALDLGLGMIRSERPAEEWAAIDQARERVRAVAAKLPAEAPSDRPYALAGGAGPDDKLAVVRD